jgi:tripartite-type tricarboxylate transporter receptor subunit TctC
MRKRDFLLGVAAAAAFAVAMPSLGHAQSYPTKPVRVIVPFAPGGGNDFVARVVMEHLSKELGQNFIVENMPGANAVVGLSAITRAKPDGYTLAISADSTLVINPLLRKDLPFSPTKDFTYIAGVSTAQLILVARADLKVKNARELVELAKKQPGKLRFGSGGVGNMTHMAFEQFAAENGVQFLHVPYPGIGPATAGLLGGDVQLGTYSIQAVLGAIQKGDLVGLGIGQKMDILPTTPTFAESGMPNYEAQTWIPLLGPAGTPPEVVKRLNDALVKVLKDPKVVDQLGRGGWLPWYKTSDEIQKLIVSDLEKWRKIIADAKIEIKQ